MPKLNQKGVAFTILLIVFLAIALIIATIFILQPIIFNSKAGTTTNIPKQVPNQPPATTSASQSCGADCQADIDSKLAQFKTDLLKELGKLPSSSTTPSQNSPKEIYLNFGVNGSTQSTDWVDLIGSDIKFNSANYPGAKGFYFQANLQTDAPDRNGYARIYDVTHSAEVSGSVINFAGLTATFKQSNAISLSSGDLQLRVQVKSELNNTLIYNPRIKVVY
jgi:hypothetical protein